MPTPTAKKPPFKKHPLTIAIQACCYTILGGSPLAVAAPTGGAVVGGSGTISQSGTATTINQATQNLAINWQSFDVAANERVQFIQPNSSAIALNRILSNNGTTIAGRIDSNGRVMLVNANGVFFTSTAVLNVGSIIASGLDINPAAFMNGNYIFNEIPGSSGAVINNGMINASLGGNVALIGKHVENNGLIVANLGTVTLAAGKQAVLTFDSGGLLGVRVSQEILQSELGVDPAVINSGEIQAQGGRVLLTASQSQDVFSRAVNTTGMEPATSVVVNDDGTFTLGSGADVLNSGTINTSGTGANQNGGRIVLLGNNVTSSGTLRADAQSGNGGEIELHARDMTLLTQNSVTSARSESNGKGGIVKVLGDKVGLFDQSTVDVSGANGGGQALIGGDFQGNNPNIRNASATYLDRNASIYADALQNGDGGKVIVWANGSTKFLGNIFTRGGSLAGNGGFVEVSGKQSLLFDGLADRSAVNGVGGTLLLDPDNITIQACSGSCSTDVITTTDPHTLAFGAGAANYVLAPGVLVSNLNSGNVLLQARSDIEVRDAISGTTNTSAHTLTLEAGDDVRINNTMTLGVNNLTLIAGSAGCGITCGGGTPRAVYVDGAIYTSGNIRFDAADNIDINQAIGGLTAVTQPATLTVRAGNDITVAGAITTNGAVTLTAADASLVASGLTVLPNGTVTGDIAVSGSVTTNGNNFTATTTTGSFRNDSSDSSRVNTGTGNVIINAVSATLGGITTTGAGSLSVTSANGQISQSSDLQRNLIIGGTSRFDATGSSGLTAINLQNGENNLQGALTLITAGPNNHATLVNKNAITTLAAVNVTGGLVVNATNNLTLSGNVTTAGTTVLSFGSGGGSSTFAVAPGLTLTTGTLTINGGSGVDTFNIESSIPGTVNGNAGADIFNIGSSIPGTVNVVTVNGNDGGDNFNITATGVSITNLYGGDSGGSGTGIDTLTGNNQVNDWQITSGDSGTLNTGTAFSGIENLVGGTGADAFTAQNGAYMSGYINGGGVSTAPLGALDTVYLLALTGNTTVQLLSSAPVPAAAIGNVVNEFTLYQVGSVTANATDSNTLTIVGGAGPNQWNISGTNSGTANGTNFVGFNELIGDAGVVDNFVFSSTGTLGNIPTGGPGRIDGGGGGDTLTVNSASGSAVTLGGSATLGTGSFSAGVPAATVDYSNITDVTVNGGASIAANNVNIGGTLRLANTTGAVTSAGLIRAGTLVLDGVGQTGLLNTTINNLSVQNSGAVYLNNTGALNLGPITTASLIDITAGGSVGNSAALTSTSLFTIRSAGNISLTNGGNALSNINLSVTGPFGTAGDVTVVNNGAVSASVVTQGGNINFTNNNGTVTVGLLDANGGLRNRLAGSYGGNITLAVTGGSVYTADPSPSVDRPVIVAQNFTGVILDGDFGQRVRPMSVMVRDLFRLQTRGAYYLFGTPPPMNPDINADLSLSFDSIGFNGRLLEIDSLDEFDPAIFTEIRNYYYEDIAIMMPADQRLDGSDEEEKEKEEKL